MAFFKDWPERKTLTLLFVLFCVEFLFLALEPYDRKDWLLENVLAVLFIAVLFFTAKRFPLTHLSYILIFFFLALHEVGAHYTYAEVPYETFFKSAFGFSLNEFMGWQRNHFDRLVHFLYGLLLAYPLRELCLKIIGKKTFWAYFLPVTFIMASSMVFELFEWGAAEFFGGDLGVAYLGTQGDVWDAHKDMALASLGALISMVICFISAKKRKKT
ncbi:DUF2238 domain-containing protein [Desulfococcaceae bacterium OttesenSCG-928-F15]|nr:DUF2238 domain-containing protein [Desulfococcaceae bacterium OttesenSCG-928-F15]